MNTIKYGCDLFKQQKKIPSRQPKHIDKCFDRRHL